jgi:catechol 2,3-dioxygenase-like lactoylglutathione lyase family enzyme
MFQGLRTVVYKVADLARAKSWYTQLLAKTPYFDEPFYVGFSVGGYELGLDQDVAGVTKGSIPVAYWGVSDAKASYARLIELGAVANAPLQDVGGGILVGSVVDPFDNVVGIIENPHFKLDT